jgi:hypothetical protein
VKTESLYDPRSKVLNPAFFDRPQTRKANAPVVDVQAARRRLRKEPVESWRESAEKLTQRTDAAAANVRSLQDAFDVASQGVARGKAGAEARQSELHDQLVSARGEHEKASAALSVAKAQLEESQQAERIVRDDDNAKKRREAHEAAKAKARAAVERHAKALAELREADKELRATVAAAVSFETFAEHSARFDVGYALQVAYVGDGVLPVVWPKGFYDLARAGFSTNPDSSVPRAAIPSIEAALSNYIF